MNVNDIYSITINKIDYSNYFIFYDYQENSITKLLCKYDKTNNIIIVIYQCTNKITGAGRGLGNDPIKNSTYAVNSSTNLPEPEQQYSGAIGQLSSTTGNIYGIYDMVGGLWEYTMGFGKDTDNQIMYGNSEFTVETMPDKKYYQSYLTSDGTPLGDGFFETSWSNFINIVEE